MSQEVTMARATIVGALAVVCFVSTPGLAQAPERDLATMRDLSADLANSYLRIWSSSAEGALADVHEVYAPRVNFYGRMLDKRAITAEKMRFVRRWPIRRYSLRPGTTRVDCDQNRRACVVRTLINWEAASPQRGTVSRGVSEFKLGVGFSGPQPLVIYEGGRVIARGGPSYSRLGMR
jgi:hypothetical protein